MAAGGSQLNVDERERARIGVGFSVGRVVTAGGCFLSNGIRDGAGTL